MVIENPDTDKRVHERVQFFLINDGSKFMSVRVFRPINDKAALALFSENKRYLPTVDPRLVWSQADKGLSLT